MPKLNLPLLEASENIKMENNSAVPASPAMPEEQKRMRQKYLWSSMQNSPKMREKPMAAPDFAKEQRANAPTRMTSADYDTEIGRVDGELTNMEAVLEEYNTLIKQQSTANPEPYVKRQSAVNPEPYAAAMQQSAANPESFDNIRLEEIRKQYGDSDDIKNRIEALKAEKWQYENQKKYNSVSENEDFGELSSKVESKSGNLLDAMLGKTDYTYEYINNVDGYRDRLNAGGAVSEKLTRYDGMSPEETAVYNYLYNKEGKKSAEEYLDYLEYTLNKRRSENTTTALEEYAAKSDGNAAAAGAVAGAAGGAGLGRAITTQTGSTATNTKLNLPQKTEAPAAEVAGAASAGVAGGAAAGSAGKIWKADEGELNRLKNDADNGEQAYTIAAKKQEQLEKDLADRRTTIIQAYAAARKSGNQQAQEFAEALLNGYQEFYNGDYLTACTDTKNAYTAYTTARDSYKSYAEKWNAWVKEQQAAAEAQAAETAAHLDNISSERNRVDSELTNLEAVLEEYNFLIKRQSTADPNSDANVRLAEIRKQYGSSKDIENQIEALKAEKWQYEKELKYATVNQNEDFRELSSKVESKSGNLLDAMLGKTDYTYEYINNVDGYRDRLNAGGAVSEKLTRYDGVSPEETAVYNYLYNKEGKKSAEEYLDYLEYTLNKRRSENTTTALEEYAAKSDGNAAAAGVMSVPANLASGLGTINVAAQNLEKKVKEAITGEYAGPIDYNTMYTGFSQSATALRKGGAEGLTNRYGKIELDAEEHPILSKVLNGKSWGDVYQLGLSMVDSASVALLSPVLGNYGTVLLGGSAATQTMLDTVGKGGTDEQALTMGLLAGTFETLFEEYSLDKLLNGNTKNILKAFLQQGFTEGSEEFFTSLANTAADVLVMADKSGISTATAQYEEQGLSPEDARKQALLDTAIGIGWDFMGGMVTGGIMGGGKAAATNVVDAATGAKNQSNTNAANTEAEGTGNQPPADGTAEAANTEETAQEAEPPVSDMEDMADRLMPVQSALTAYRETGTVSNRLTEIILGQSKAVQELTEQTGIEITGTKSQQRSAVREAIAALAAQEDAAKAQEANTPEAIKARQWAEASQEAMGMPVQSNIDNSNGNKYADTITTQGGTEYGTGLQQNDRGRSTGDSAPGVAGVQQSDGAGNRGRGQPRGVAQHAGILRVSSPQGADTSEKSAEDGQIPEGFEAMGAASAGFSGAMEYNDLLRDGNVQPSRATDAKYEEAPIRDSYGRKVTEFTHNVIDSEVISERDVGTVKRLVADGAFGHDVQKMDAVRQTAVDKIRDKKPGYVANAVTTAVNGGKFNEHTVAEAEILFAYYTNRGGEDAAARAEEMLLDLSQMATSTGRQLNMFKLLRRLTPEGQMRYIRQNIDHEVDKINSNRSRKKQVQVEIPQELQDDYLDATRDVMDPNLAVQATIAKTVETGLDEDILAAADASLTEIPRYEPRSRTNANITNNDMAERVGKRVADSLTRQAQRQELSVEDILYREIMRFANDKAEAGRTKTKSATSANLDTLRDYYRYQTFFQSAWNTARDRVEQAMFSMQDGDPRISVIEQFLTSGDPIGAMDFGNPKSTVRRAAKEAANAAGIRMDNSAGRDNTRIRQQMRDVLTENAHDKEAAAREIARIAANEAGLSDDAAEAMAEDVMRAFYNDLSQRSARRVAELFGTGNTQRQAVQKTMAEKLGELYNLGAFSNEQYRQAAFDSIFGEGSGITVSDKLLERFVNAAGEEQAAAENAIYAYVAAQIPATIEEKLDAWRHLCMLGNVKTQERNFFGSAAFHPMVAIRRNISAGLQRVVLQQENRTRATLGMGKDARKLLSWAKTDAKSKAAQETMKYSGYTGNQARSKIDEYRTIFNFKPLEAARTGLQSLMEGTDMVWKKKEYARSLAGFLKAKGYTAEQAQNGNVPANVMQEGRELAVQDAMKATFNDSNKFSDALSRMRFKGNGTLSRAGNIMLKGTVPYLRTPANILVRYVEYNPAGLVKGFNTLIRKVRNGEATVAQGLDEIAAGLTGTGAMLLGAALRYGLIPGVRLWGDLDDEEAEAMNVKPFSLQVGSTCYGMEFLAPATITMFTGANIAQKFEKYGGFENMDGWDVVSALAESTASGLNPILEMSVLSSLNDIVQNVAYEDTAGDKVIAFVTTAATNYLMQFLPTLGGHLERAAEENQKTAYSDADNAIQRSVEMTIGRATQKIPGIDLFQADKVDSHGNVVRYGDNWFTRIADAVVNPTTVAKIDDGPVAQEIARLNQLPDTNASAPTIPKTVSYTDAKGIKHDNERLTAEQYTTVQSVTRKTAETILNTMIGSTDYAALTDEQKAEAFGYAYDYAQEMGRTAAIEGYDGMDSWMEGIEGKESEAIIRKVALGSLADSLLDVNNAITAGWSTDASAKNMEAAYNAYKGLSEAAQKQIKEQAGDGAAGKYIAAREAGVTNAEYVRVLKKVAGLQPQTGYKNVRDIQEAQAIGKMLGLDDAEKETLIKGYVSDSQDENIDQVKDMGFDINVYLKAWEKYDSESGDGKKKRVIESYQQLFGIDHDAAQKLYEVFG